MSERKDYLTVLLANNELVIESCKLKMELLKHQEVMAHNQIQLIKIELAKLENLETSVPESSGDVSIALTGVSSIGSTENLKC